MRVAFLDFETQSADPKTTLPTEVACVKMNYQDKTWSPGEAYTDLMWEVDYLPQTEQIVALTGITDQMLKTKGIPRDIVFRRLLTFLADAEVIVAHKIDFDKTVLDVQTKAVLNEVLPTKFWLCTLTNFPWPPKYTCHKLGHMGWEHDIPVKASELHRALDDVLLLSRIVQKYNFDDVLKYAAEPWVYLKASVAKPWEDEGVQAAIARGLGFAFEKCKGTDKPSWPKTWVARFKASQVDSIAERVKESASPFSVFKIEGIS